MLKFLPNFCRSKPKPKSQKPSFETGLDSTLKQEIATKVCVAKAQLNAGEGIEN